MKRVIIMVKTTVLKVPDMTCGHCELSVQEALDELDGVERAKADHATSDVEVAYDEGKVSVEQMGEAIEEVGYTLQS
jgi:copper chaperone